MTNIVISSLSSTTITDVIYFHRRFSHTTNFGPLPAHDNQLFRSFKGAINFPDVTCKGVHKHKPTNKVVQSSDINSNTTTCITNSQEVLLPINNDIKKYVDAIQSVFGALDDGATTVSAYDTAWVALIENVNGGPQFPSSLEWIANNQLPDGSWGESLVFLPCDRLVNTLACVVALTTWNVHPDKCNKGMKFVNETMNKLGGVNEEYLTPGFEVVFLKLIELAHKLEIKVRGDSPILKELYARRDMKLTRIPKDILYKIPTTLLYSIEGLKDLEWDKLLKLQAENGSFVQSAAPTAFAFMQTKNENCLAYLTNLVTKFNGGVPCSYPVDMFERSWMVDRLKRLGIARYFHFEIKDCVDYIYRYWDDQGIGFGRNSNLPDLDDTAMAFRVLRTNGYQVSTDAFRAFEKHGEFVCYPGQSTEGVTVMLNLYKASQLRFPGEKILDDAEKFSYNFLTEKRLNGNLLDRWIITKDLPGEVAYAIDVPWYASLPRLETRYYLEQYGGEDDVWIAKTLYRMKNVSNGKYLEMAKLDYNHCQAIHQMEWIQIQKWYKRLNLEESIKTRPLWLYYEAMASIFEPERCHERVAWTKTAITLEIITSFVDRAQLSNADKQEFVSEFTNSQYHHKLDGKPWHTVLNALHETINHISSEALRAHGVDILPYVHCVWKTWLLEWLKGEGIAGEAQLIVQMVYMSKGRWLSDATLSHPQYRQMSSALSDLCHLISLKWNHKMESKMQELVQLVLSDSLDSLDQDLKDMFLIVAKTLYYRASYDPETINLHVGKVLFENVM